MHPITVRDVTYELLKAGVHIDVVDTVYHVLTAAVRPGPWLVPHDPTGEPFLAPLESSQPLCQSCGAGHSKSAHTGFCRVTGNRL